MIVGTVLHFVLLIIVVNVILLTLRQHLGQQSIDRTEWSGEKQQQEEEDNEQHIPVYYCIRMV